MFQRFCFSWKKKGRKTADWLMTWFLPYLFFSLTSFLLSLLLQKKRYLLSHISRVFLFWAVSSFPLLNHPVWPSHLSQWHLMWSGMSPGAYSHWLIKTHMRREDSIWSERSGLLSEGLIIHSHWVACPLSHSWLSVCMCVCVKCYYGCDLVYVGRATEREWDRLQLESGDLCVRTRSSEEVHSWVVSIQLADDPFRSNLWKRACKHTPAQTCGAISGSVRGAVWLVTGSLTSPRFFF